MRLVPALLIGLLMPAAAWSQAVPATQPAAQTVAANALPSVFDPARHMRVEEVREGMKGYGLSVLSGTKITKFDVEVITVLKNSLGTQRSVVMIRCLDEYMQHVGSIAGCSGSPIYLYDDTGKARLIGAYAFGWDLARDPFVGVQPIEYMLTLDKQTQPSDARASSNAAWSLLKSQEFAAFVDPKAHSLIKQSMQSNEGIEPRLASSPHLQRLMTPLSVSGMSQDQIDRFAPMLRERGFEPMLAMGGGATVPSDVKIEPGSVLGAAMLSGDLNLAAIGTCTEVINGRAYGFGHPFTGEGATSVPMGAGAINLIMPLLTSSFKLGSVGEVTGAIDMDGAYGVAGEIGAKARTFPIVVEVDDQSAKTRKTFNYQCALHQAMTPMIVGIALQSSLSSDKELPKDHTINYELDLQFEGNRTLKMSNIASSLAGDDVSQMAVWPATLLANNPLKRINLEGVRAKAVIHPGVETAEILTASLNQATYKPGEKVAISLRLKPYRGDVYSKSIELDLPAILPDGDYVISIADAQTSLQMEVQGQPHRFAVRNIDELFKTIQTVIDETKNDRIFVRLVGAEQNIAIGRTSLKKLPASKRSILAAAARPDTAPTNSASLKVFPMDRPISGGAELTIHVLQKIQ